MYSYALVQVCRRKGYVGRGTVIRDSTEMYVKCRHWCGSDKRGGKLNLGSYKIGNCHIVKILPSTNTP